MSLKASISPSNSGTCCVGLFAANSTPHCGWMSFTNCGNSHDCFNEHPYLDTYSFGFAHTTPKCLISLFN